MTHRDSWTPRLSEYVDGDLPPDLRGELETHLGGCADCRAVVADLERIRERAAALGDREPPRDLWPGIAARIGAAPAPAVTPIRRRWSFTLPQLAAAAVVLLALGAGSAGLLLRGGVGAGPVAAGPADGPVVIPAAFTADESYDEAVTDLARILAAGRDRLDTATVRVLEQSLRTIDRAIARARAALERDPNDPYLNEHLAETMRRKINLMRRAADLVATS